MKTITRIAFAILLLAVVMMLSSMFATEVVYIATTPAQVDKLLWLI